MTSDMQFRPDQLAEYLRFQTVEQALEDIVVFARAFSFPRLSGVDLRPGNTPWVFLGISYPLPPTSAAEVKQCRWLLPRCPFGLGSATES